MTTRIKSRRLAATPLTRSLPAIFILAAVMMSASGCEKEKTPLALADLSPDEYRYVERMVVLERAKSLALVDRPAGEAALDSLAAAWGDSSLVETSAGVPRDPVRSEEVALLLRRVLEAEQDSLLVAPGANRLGLPLPDPPPVPVAPEPET